MSRYDRSARHTRCHARAPDDRSDRRHRSPRSQSGAEPAGDQTTRPLSARRDRVGRGTAGLWAERRGDLTEQIREAFDREGVLHTQQVARVSEVTYVPHIVGHYVEKVEQARQLAYPSEVTYPGEDLFPGHYVEGFAEAWDRIAAGWQRAPGPADRWHVETHMADRRDVFITDDRRLLKMCLRLREHGFPIVAMKLGDYLDRRR
jgi:hypothetical protein